MPIYEYECEKCHQIVELLQSFHNVPETQCPKCVGKAHRIISPPAILFKGAGFHVTDYRSGTLKAGSENSQTPSPAPESKTEKPKPESKKPTTPPKNPPKSKDK
jgi:putative FmdB family regulatory protein